MKQFALRDSLAPAGSIGRGQLQIFIEQQFALYNCLPIHVGCVDASGFYTFWNIHSEKMFGYLGYEIIGVFGPEIVFANRNGVPALFRAARMQGMFNEEVVLRHREGHVFPAQFAIIPLKTVSGAVSCYYEFAQDITVFKGTRKEIESLKSALAVLLEKSADVRRDCERSLIAMLNSSILPHLKNIERCCGRTPAVREDIEAIASCIRSFKSSSPCFAQSGSFELTPMETEIAQFVLVGKCTKEIAAMLGISTETVEFHRKNIRKKLGISNRKVNLRSHLASLSR